MPTLVTVMRAAMADFTRVAFPFPAAVLTSCSAHRLLGVTLSPERDDDRQKENYDNRIPDPSNSGACVMRNRLASDTRIDVDAWISHYTLALPHSVSARYAKTICSI
jgi:hypothetical protein